MQSIPKRVCTHEHRAEAVDLVLAEDLGGTPTSRKLGLSVQTYSRWIHEARVGVLARVDMHLAQPVSDLRAEVSRLKRELAITCEDRDVSKKAVAQPLLRAVAALRSSPSEVRAH